MEFILNSKQLEIQPKLAAANINPSSFLATDYLNHYNEIVMLLEMVPDMPDLAVDTYAWAPKSYIRHFQESGFTARDLAVEAYENAPLDIKIPFERIVSETDSLIVSTVAGLKAVGVAERGLEGPARDFLLDRVARIQRFTMQMNRLIHGQSIDETSSEIEVGVKVAHDEDAHSQADIDALFD